MPPTSMRYTCRRILAGAATPSCSGTLWISISAGDLSAAAEGWHSICNF